MKRLLALHGSQGHLRFESRAVVPAWSSAHCLSCSAAILAAIRQKLHSSHCAEIPSQLYQPEPFFASDDVNVLYPMFDNMDEYVALFVCTVIRQEKYRYN